VLAGALLRLAVIAAGQLAWPFDLELETPQLCVIRAIRGGLNPYGPGAYSAGPFALAPYPPLYLWLVAWLPAAPGQPFLVGRLLSLAAMLAACALLFRAGGPRTLRPLAALSAGWFFLLGPPAGHAAYLRMDSLGLALSAGALVLLSGGGTARVLAAALLCALAVAAKQSFVAAGAAGLLFLWMRDRRRAPLFAGALALLLVGGGLAASGTWGQGFWFNLLAPARLPSSLAGLAQAWSAALHQKAFVALLAVAAGVAVLATRHEGLAWFGRSPWPAYALCSGAVLCRSAAVVGSNELYFIEFALALLLWLTGELGREGGMRLDEASSWAALALVVLLAGHELIGTWTRIPGLPLPSGRPAEQARGYFAAARAGLAARGWPAPSVLNLGSPAFASGVADDVRLNYPWLYDQMWAAGLLSPDPLIEAIDRRDFDLVLVAAEVPLPPLRQPGEARVGVLDAVLRGYRPIGQDLVFRYFERGP